MIIKTTGLVLRLDPFSRTSQVITWLTPDHGRTATLAKGAKRPKNNLIGQYDCFYTCEMLFYQSRHSALHILKECTPLNPREALRSDWRASFTASYLCDLLTRLTPPGAPCTPLFEWTDKTLDFLAQNGTSETVMNWAELKLLGLLGIKPKLSDCLACGTRKWPEDTPPVFSVPRGGLLCLTCKCPQDSLTLCLPHDVLAMLKGWETTPTPHMAKRTVCTNRQAQIASNLLGAFIHYHLESSRSRDIAANLLT